MTKLFGFIIIFFLPIELFAQVTNLTGKIVNKETNATLTGVNVSVYGETDIIYHTITDSTGSFYLPIGLLNKINHIKISAFNFDDLLIKKLPETLNAKNPFLGNFKIIPHVIELNEVKIKANKRYRDTTKIDLSKEKFERSVMIEDIFSTNGFSKDANGLLYYKGKPVADLVVNGKTFFGNNNDVFNLLPALALNGVEITETNIDSVTNTTTLHPQIKVNLKLKNEYDKGKFGNASLGLGTLKRNLAAANIYSYRNNEQLTIGLNTNNINIGSSPPLEPVINFSANGNDSRTRNLTVNYHNTLLKKIELDFSVKAKQEAKYFRSESTREDDAINQQSKIVSSTDSKSYGLSDINLSLVYPINAQNSLSLVHTGNYYKTNLNDSLNYTIQSLDAGSVSTVFKNRIDLSNNGNTEIVYKHLSSVKKGRQVELTFLRKAISDENTERDLIYGSNNNNVNSYFISGNQKLNERNYSFKTELIEPLKGNSSYINFFASYTRSNIDYKYNAVSDSLNLTVEPAEVSNQYVQSGAKYQKTLDRVSFDGSLYGLLNLRTAYTTNEAKKLTFWNLNGYLKTDYKFNEKKNLKVTVQTITNYPETNQLVNVNNSYDVISQTTNNVNLKPEVKNSLNIGFYNRLSSSESLNISADFNYYLDRFGLNTIAVPNTTQKMFIDNIGNAITASANLNIAKSIFNLPINSYTTVFYFEQPSIINNEFNKNSGVNISQSFSSNKQLIENVLSVSPTVGGTYGKYFYRTSTISSYTFNYSDKLLFKVAKFELELRPLLTYSNSINSLFSFSTNAAIKRRIFHDYGLIWIQGYDIFNSFRIQNNLFGSTYKQTTQYSNINRYIIFGLNFKFNNIK